MLTHLLDINMPEFRNHNEYVKVYLDNDGIIHFYPMGIYSAARLGTFSKKGCYFTTYPLWRWYCILQVGSNPVPSNGERWYNEKHTNFDQVSLFPSPPGLPGQTIRSDIPYLVYDLALKSEQYFFDEGTKKELEDFLNINQ